MRPVEALIELRRYRVLRRGQGLPPLSPQPFLRYRHPSVATLRWCSGSSRNVFGFLPETAFTFAGISTSGSTVFWSRQGVFPKLRTWQRELASSDREARCRCRLPVTREDSSAVAWSRVADPSRAGGSCWSSAASTRAPEKARIKTAIYLVARVAQLGPLCET